MSAPLLEVDAAIRLAIAALIGLGVGLEREWSGHTTGPDARFAGLRTFLLLGIIGGASGLLAERSYDAVAAMLVAGGVALAVCAYVIAVRRPDSNVDGTTEVAAIVVLALGALAGIGWLALAAGAASLVVLALSEKTRLHWAVRRVGDAELRAALQFTVLALVILPLLPQGPFLGVLAVRPRALWIVVLLFCGLNYVGYLARRIAGASRGYAIAGALGGAISSTAVTLNFSRLSRSEASSLGVPLARGVLAACTVLIPRVLIVSAAFDPRVTLALLPLVVPPFVLGVLIIAFGWRRGAEAPPSAPVDHETPLRLGAALRMTIAFQVALSVIAIVSGRWGSPGVYATAAVLGLTDMDALTVSMSSPASGLVPYIAAHALAIGILSNTLLKLTVAVVLGTATYRRAAAAGLIGLAAASLAGFFLG